MAHQPPPPGSFGQGFQPPPHPPPGFEPPPGFQPPHPSPGFQPHHRRNHGNHHDRDRRRHNHRRHHRSPPRDHHRNRDRDSYHQRYRRGRDDPDRRDRDGGRDRPKPKEDIFVGLDVLFQKRMQLNTKDIPGLPSAVDVLPGGEKQPQDPKLLEQKLKVNAVRGKLDEKDIVLWKKHTRFMNHTSNVSFQVRKNIKSEMTTVAFCKMFEILAAYNLAPREEDGPAVRTAHLCEAPGAFICATNHYLRQKFQDDLQLEWTGLSLNPYYEDNDPEAMIDVDAFIVQTMPHWYFGTDNKGDIRCAQNILDLKKDIRGAHIVTADGSIDCSANPDEQENMVAHLHMCEAIAATQVLAPGGHFVLKMFTYFERSSLDILYFLACLFEELHVCKPATSTQGNGETYVVAKGFKDNLSEDVFTKMLGIVDERIPYTELPDFFADHVIPLSFKESVCECAVRFSTYMTDVIERNLRTEGNLNYVDKDTISKVKWDVYQRYLKATGIFPIPPRAQLSRPGTDGSIASLSQHGNSASNKRKVGGTLEHRRTEKDKRVESREANRNFGRKRKVDEIEDDTSDASNKGPDAMKIDSAEADDKDESNPNSKRVKTEAEAREVRYGSFATRMLNKMGYKEGAGLGKDEAGIANPVEVDIRDGRTGLGFHNMDVEKLTTQIPHAPFFDSTDGPYAAPCSKPHSLLLAAAERRDSHGYHGNISTSLLGPRAQCIITGDPLKNVSMSKFVNHAALVALVDARRSLAENPMLRDRAHSQRLGTAYHAAMACKKNPFSDATGDSLKLALLDAFFDTCALSSSSKRNDQHDGPRPLPSPMKGDGGKLSVSPQRPSMDYIVVGRNVVGVAEYMSWKHGPAANGALFSHMQATVSSKRFQVGWVDSSSQAKVENGSNIDEYMAILESCISAAGTDETASCQFVFLDMNQTSNLVHLIDNGHLCSELTFDDPKGRKLQLLELQMCLKRLCKQKIQKGGETISGTGGDMIVRIGDCFTRWSNSILFILYSIFEDFRIVKPYMSSPLDPERFVVCRGYIGYDHAVNSGDGDRCDSLDDLFEQAYAACNAGKSLLSLVAMDVLLQPQFLNYMKNSNDRLCERQIAAYKFLETDDVVYADGDLSFKSLGDEAVSRIHFDGLQENLSLEASEKNPDYPNVSASGLPPAEREKTPEEIE